eukprot:gene21432-27761_t
MFSSLVDICLADIYEKNNPDRVVLGLGLSNLASGLFGGFGGSGLIPNTMLNGKSGGEGYASEYSYSFSLVLSILVFGKYIKLVPLAAIAGLMFVIGFNTFEWNETKEIAIKFIDSWKGESLDKSSKITSSLNFIGAIVTFLICYKVDMLAGILSGTFIVSLDKLES